MTLAPERVTPSDRQNLTNDLWAEYAHVDEHRRGDIEAEIIRTNLPLARSIAGRYNGRGISSEDLFQVACLGLVKAVKGFNPERGDFLGYAVPTIRGEVRRHFRDAGWVIRPPRRVQELQPRLWAAEEELTQSLDRAPTVAELAAHLCVADEDVIESLSLRGCFAPGSLDVTYESDGESGGGIGDRLGDDDPEIGLLEDRLLLSGAMEGLDERSRIIVQRRFFDGWTQAQIGEELGVSQVQVSRLIAQILATLRAKIS